MSVQTAPATVKAKGYARLSPGLRTRIGDLLCMLAPPAALLAAFMGSRIEGVWVRLPLLLALVVLVPATWFVNRKVAAKVPAVAASGLIVACMGVGVLAMAMLHASPWAALAGLIAFLAALALRASVERTMLRGREVRLAKRKPLTTLFDQIESLAAALVLVLLVWHFGLEAFRIPSGSMAPTLLGDPVSGDRVLVDKFVYAWRDPERWEPVVFRYPLRRTDPYVKRCIALPGEEVLIAQGDVYVREPGSGKIVLLRKTPRARDELWLPIIEDLDSPTAWVKHFQRDGDVDFKDGVIMLGKGSRASFPRGVTDDKPGYVTDHDASFGATETPKDRFGKHAVADLRIRASVVLSQEGSFSVSICREGVQYDLELGIGVGACSLVRRNRGTRTVYDAPELNSLALEEGVAYEVVFSFADGELLALVDGNECLKLDEGTQLLDVLNSRDNEKQINLAGPEALRLASAEPVEAQQAGIILGGKAQVRVLGIDRDIYYIGRTLEGDAPRELPFQVHLGEDQYLVLGDNSPGSADCRFWTRITLFLSDGTEVTGSMDEASQPELVRLLAQSAEPGQPVSALEKLFRVAHFAPAERGEADVKDGDIITQSLELLQSGSKNQGRAAIDFYTEGGGFVRIKLADIERVQVSPLPYVERKLFVGRPFAVFLSPRGMKLID